MKDEKECVHKNTIRIGEIGGRFGDEWCKDCGALKSWDNYVDSRATAVWVKPVMKRAGT